MCIGRKPPPFGNERDTICCDLTYILWISHIVEGKDHHQQLVKKEYSELGRTASLMLKKCKPIFGTGKAVILESGFCVTKDINEKEAKGFYVGYLIKKRCYWPKGVPINLIDTHFQHKEVGDDDIIEARTQENNLFQIFFYEISGLCDDDYVKLDDT